MANLIEDLIKQGWLKTPRLIETFQRIGREDFLPQGFKYLAELNEALPIGKEQTISQPLTVAFMLELLQPQKGDKILDIGSGSGWTAALLAYCVSQQGKIIAIEIIPEIAEFGRKNAAKYNFMENGTVEFIVGDGSQGYKNEAPYDKILASASLQENDIPKAWKEQLKIGGRLVCPIKNSIWLFVKKSKGEFKKFEYPGFVFVPLTHSG